ncbi:MAG: TolC family protein [Betaproteobacteria bacterium]|nr:TolC family protein [Betaproteobacteria bacterium]
MGVPMQSRLARRGAFRFREAGDQMTSNGNREVRQRAQAMLSAALLMAAAATAEIALADDAHNMDEANKAESGRHGSVVLARSAPIAAARLPDASLQQLVVEALKHNPEIAAAGHEKNAAGHRVSPAGALDDPMLEAGLLNVPAVSLRLNREDMTMKMLGIAQKLPYPGKRDLRQDVAAKNAESVAFGYRETVGRVAREVKVAYFDLALIDRTIALMERSRLLIAQLLRIAEGRYAVGQGAQAEVLKAQTQLARMAEERVRMRRERRTTEADLQRALGRGPDAASIRPDMPRLDGVPLRMEALLDEALKERPQLLGLRSLIEKNQKALDLARKEYYPDFDVRFAYGQRERNLEGTPRSDMFSLTVAINLPVWRKDKRDPMVAEAQAMRAQAVSLYEAQHNDLIAKLRQQVAIAEQSRESARLFETGILPQARLALDSALAAYRVNRVDFRMLLDSQMTVLNYEINHAAAVVALNKALAEIDQLTGRQLAEPQAASSREERP